MANAAERGLSTTVKVVGAVVGVVSSVTALLFTFWPDLRPSGDAPEQSAKLSELKVDPDAPFRLYLARIDQPATSYTAERLAERGALLDFRVEITGFKGKELLLKWELFDEETGREVDESKAIAIRPTNPTNKARWQFWVPLPEDGGQYFAVVALLEQKRTHGLQLDSLQTDPLPGLG